MNDFERKESVLLWDLPDSGNRGYWLQVRLAIWGGHSRLTFTRTCEPMMPHCIPTPPHTHASHCILTHLHT